MTSKRIISFFLCILIAFFSFSQDTALITQLLKRIEQLQVKRDGVFPKGAIPSYRTYALNKDRQKADVNPFYTGLVAMTLKSLRNELDTAQVAIADRIISECIPVFSKFRNRSGRHTYNFWPKDTPQIFPHAGWLNLFDKKQSLPDDLDDTVILLLSMDTPDSVVKQVHALMQDYTNTGRKNVRNTFKAYRHIGAYSTWFGKKMPVDFDVCVLANILYFVQRYQLDWTPADSASLQLIEKVIRDRKHITAASYVSPHYSKLPKILYHLSRLMSVRPIAALEALKPQLIEETKQALQQANGFMDKVILHTALLRWGVHLPVLSVHQTRSLQELVEEGDFSFFIANMASILPDPLKQWMGGTGAGKFYYDCQGYNNLLLLEYVVWNKKFSD